MIDVLYVPQVTLSQLQGFQSYGEGDHNQPLPRSQKKDQRGGLIWFSSLQVGASHHICPSPFFTVKQKALHLLDDLGPKSYTTTVQIFYIFEACTRTTQTPTPAQALTNTLVNYHNVNASEIADTKKVTFPFPCACICVCVPVQHKYFPLSFLALGLCLRCEYRYKGKLNVNARKVNVTSLQCWKNNPNACVNETDQVY